MMMKSRPKKLGKAVPFNTLAGVLSSGNFQLLQCYIGLDVKRLGKYYCLFFRQRCCIQAHAGQGASLVSTLQVCCPLPDGFASRNREGTLLISTVTTEVICVLLAFEFSADDWMLLSKQPTLPMRTLSITSG